MRTEKMLNEMFGKSYKNLPIIKIGGLYNSHTPEIIVLMPMFLILGIV
jgi:hypothetical protein